MRIEIRELQRRLGITSIYVTHDQAEALAISDRIVVMNRGRIEQVGDPGTDLPRAAHQLRRRFPRRREHRGCQGARRGRGRIRPSAACRGAELLPAAGPVKLSWRPEDMKIAHNGAGNIAGAHVASVVFRGNFTELVVEIGGHQLLRAQVESDLGVREGDTVGFALSPRPHPGRE